MPARKLEWLDPIVEDIVAQGKDKLPLLFEYLELCVAYLFELLIITIVARLYHLHHASRVDLIEPIADRLLPLLEIEADNPLGQIQATTAQCLGILPLSEQTIAGLRSVPEIDRKNCYRRITDAIGTLGEMQIYLLALAYEDGEYERFFNLDLNLPIDPEAGDDL